MLKKTKLTSFLLLIHLFAWSQNAFDSIIVGQTKNFLPNEVVTYTFNYCSKNLETDPYTVFNILIGLKNYLNEHTNIKQWPSYYYQLANFYLLTDQPDSALLNYNKSLSYQGKLSAQTLLKTNLAVSYIHSIKNNITESFSILSKINDKIQHENSPELLGLLHKQYAINNVHEENYSAASIQFQKAINYFKQINDTIKIAQTNNELGHMYVKLGNYPMAIDFFEKAESIFRKSGCKWHLANNQLKIGETHFYASHLPDALRYLVSAEALFKHFGSPNKLLHVYLEKGKTYTALRNFDQAKLYLFKALNISEEQTHKPQYSTILLNIGNMHYKRELYRKAQIFYLKSLDHCSLPDTKLSLYDKLSDINSKLKNFSEAYKYQVLYNGMQRNILLNQINTKEKQLKREFERQYSNAESEKALMQKELAILIESKNKRKNIFRTTLFTLLVVILFLLIILLRKRSSNKKLQVQLRETIKLQRDEISKNTEMFDHLSKSSERILNLSTKNIWEPFWVLENITNEIVDQEFKEDLNINSKAFDDDQLIMARNLLENILYWSMNQQKQIELHPNVYTIDQLLKPIIKTQTIRAKAKKITLKYNQSLTNKLYIDKQTVQVALRNIIENAIKFSTLNGYITVTVKPSNKFTEVVIHDDGVGMTKEQIKSLFTNSKPHQASGTHGEKGVGLGLNLAKDFVEINFGKLSIESSVAYGTTVTVLLPNKD